MTPPWKAYLDSLQIKDLKEIFRTSKPIIGMVHCWPLPGAPGYTGYSMQTIVDHALRDAHTLAEGGIDGLIVENMWDIPFRAGPHVQPESIATHAVVAHAVRLAVDLPMGINLATHIEWTRFFGADALIVSGRMTGDAPDIGKVREAKSLAGDRPLLIGSGADEHNIGAFMGVADGVIVGSSIKAGERCENAVDAERVRRFVAAARDAV